MSTSTLLSEYLYIVGVAVAARSVVLALSVTERWQGKGANEGFEAQNEAQRLEVLYAARMQLMRLWWR